MGNYQDAHEPEYEPLSLIRRATAFAMDAAMVWATTAALYRLSGNILPSDPEQASYCFHIARLLLSVAYHAVMLRWLAGTMGHVAVKGTVVVANTGNRPGTARCALRALLGALDVLIVPLLINTVITVVRRDRRHLYDLCAGTRVVLYHKPQREPS